MLQRLDRFITKQRLRNYSAIILFVWAVSLVSSIVLGSPPRDVFDKPVLPDFLAHWLGGRLLIEYGPSLLYDLDAQRLVQNQTVGEHHLMIWFINPPFAALFYLPFAALPYLPSAALWAVLTVCLLFVSAQLLRPLVPQLAEQHWNVVLLAVAATPPVLELMASGQDSALSLFLWMVGIRFALARRDGAAGAMFALGLFKPQLFLLPPLVFLCWWRVRALLGWTLTAALLGTLSLGMVGLEGLRAWLALPLSPEYRHAIQAGQAWKMQTIPALLTASAPPDAAPTAEVVGLLLGLLLIGAFVKYNLRVRRVTQRQEAISWALAGLTTLLVSPHLALYDLVLLIPAALLLVEYRNERSVRLALLAIVLLNWSLGVRHLLALTLPWPFLALGASWTALPLLVLWLALLRTGQEVPSPPAARPPSRQEPLTVEPLLNGAV